MKLSIFEGFCGGGAGGGSSSKSARKTGLISKSKTGTNNMAITGSIALILVWSFVGDCLGKPFHAGGQAEIEEDTTQGSLKEKFPPAGSLIMGSSSSGGGGAHSPLMDDSLLEEIGDEDENDDDAIMVGNVGLVPLGGTQDDSLQQQRWADYKGNRHIKHPAGGNSNYGVMVHKRSLGGGGGRSPYSFDDDEEFQRLQRSNDNNRPMYYEQTSGSAAPAGVDGSSSSAVRQKLMHLRNQYGDKWYAFMGPYAYRKRQILYRQCFFNPISCF